MLTGNRLVSFATSFATCGGTVVTVALCVVLAAPLAQGNEIGFVVDPDAILDQPFDIFWVDRLTSQGHNVTVLPVNYDPTGPAAVNLDIFIISNDVGSGEFLEGMGIVPEVEFTGFEGSVWYGGGDLDAGFAGGPPRLLNLNPVDLSGQSNVELTIGLAARPTGWDDGIDFFKLRLDTTGDMNYDTEVADFQPLGGDLQDTISGLVLNTEFQDLTIPIPAGVDTLRLQIEGFSTATGEQLGFDSIRVTGTGGTIIGSENFEGGDGQIGFETVGRGGAGAAFWDSVGGAAPSVSSRVTDPRPIITYETALYDDFQMSSADGDRIVSDFVVIEEDHPLAAGIAKGEFAEVFDFPQGVSFLAGDLAPGLDVIASADNFQPAIAVLEMGAEGIDGNPAPGQRIAIFPQDASDPSFYIEDGLALLDAAVEYALSSIVPPPNPNDCNNDGVFDINDTLCATPDTLGGILTAANLIQGDADGDGTVAFADFLTLSANFGQDGSYTEGNFDLLDNIAFADFLILSANFGQSSGAAAAVPEPSSFLLLLCCSGILAIRRNVLMSIA